MPAEPEPKRIPVHNDGRIDNRGAYFLLDGIELIGANTLPGCRWRINGEMIHSREITVSKFEYSLNQNKLYISGLNVSSVLSLLFQFH